MKKTIWIVKWWPAKYEEGLIIGGFWTEESACEFVANSEDSNAYGIFVVEMEEENGS